MEDMPWRWYWNNGQFWFKMPKSGRMAGGSETQPGGHTEKNQRKKEKRRKSMQESLARAEEDEDAAVEEVAATLEKQESDRRLHEMRVRSSQCMARAVQEPAEEGAGWSRSSWTGESWSRSWWQTGQQGWQWQEQGGWR